MPSLANAITPWSGANLNIKNLDVVDLEATSVSCTNLTVDGESLTPTDVTTLQTKTQNQSAVAGTTTFTGDLDVGDVITATGGFTGTLLTTSQPNITSVGTLTGLSSSGNISATGTVTGSSGLVGTLTTAAQPNITSVGTLTSLSSSGNISTTGTVTGSSGLVGTLSTAAQGNVTSVGTLTSLAVSGDVTVDTNVLKVDTTNDRIGINTTSPATTLDITDNSTPANYLTVAQILAPGQTSRTTQMRIGVATTTGNAVLHRFYYAGDNNDGNRYSFSFNGATTNAISILKGGNVGIGLDAPTEKLHVYGSSKVKTDFSAGWDNSSGTYAAFNVLTQTSPTLNQVLCDDCNFIVGSSSLSTETLAVYSNLKQVSIAGATPTEALNVTGKIKLSDTIIPYSSTGITPTVGQVGYTIVNAPGANVNVTSGTAVQFNSISIGVGVWIISWSYTVTSSSSSTITRMASTMYRDGVNTAIFADLTGSQVIGTVGSGNNLSFNHVWVTSNSTLTSMDFTFNLTCIYTGSQLAVVGNDSRKTYVHAIRIA